MKYRLGSGSIQTEKHGDSSSVPEWSTALPRLLTFPTTPRERTRFRVWRDLANDADRSQRYDSHRTFLSPPVPFLECAETDSESQADYDCNGGCNDLTPTYQDIVCGQTVCGVSFTYGDRYRDTDWFRFTVTERTTMSATIRAEFGLEFELLTGDCPPDWVVYTYEYDPCVEKTIMIPCLTPGDYVLFVASDWYPDLPLSDSARYYLSLDCRPSAFSAARQ